MFEAPLALALPDGEAPGFNDNSGGNIRTAAPLYELAYGRWRRPEYGRLAAQSDRNNLQALLYGAATLPQRVGHSYRQRAHERCRLCHAPRQRQRRGGPVRQARRRDTAIRTS